MLCRASSLFVDLRHRELHRLCVCPQHTAGTRGQHLSRHHHQLRIHQAQRTDFYLRSASGPINEHSSTLRFAPSTLSYGSLAVDLEVQRAAQSYHLIFGQAASLSKLEDAHFWSNVEDFNWLRQQQVWRALSCAAESVSRPIGVFFQKIPVSHPGQYAHTRSRRTP